MDKIIDKSLDEYIASFKAEREDNRVKSGSNEKSKAVRRANDEEGESLDDNDVFREILDGLDASSDFIDLDMPDKDAIDAMATEEQNDLEPHSTQTQVDSTDDQRFRPQLDSCNNMSGIKEIEPDLKFNSQQEDSNAGIPPLLPPEVFEEVRSRKKRNCRNRGWKRGDWKRNEKKNGVCNANGIKRQYKTAYNGNKMNGPGNDIGYGITNGIRFGNANWSQCYYHPLPRKSVNIWPLAPSKVPPRRSTWVCMPAFGTGGGFRLS